MGFLRDIAEQSAETWRALSTGHRIIMVLLGIVCIGSVAAVVVWREQPRQRILFSGMKAEECAEVSKILSDAGIPAEMSAGGTGLLVPESRLQEARMVAAQEGVPSNPTQGFRMFREPKLGMTPFAEKVTFIDALQSELASTIMSLDAVRHARVHLAVPERQIFADNERQSSASVLVVSRRGEKLSKRQVVGVTNLVASAVEKLSAEDVTVTDGRGNVLSGSGQSGSEAYAGDQWSYRRRIETDLARKAESMLSQLLGPGQADVQVSADIVFENRTQRQESYDADNKVLVKEKIESQQSSGGGNTVGGAVGAGQEEAEVATGGGGNGSSSKTEDIETEYLVGKSVTEQVDRGAVINRLSVAACVDLGSEKDAKGGPAVDQIRQTICQAVGFQESRGDSLTVTPADFPDPQPEVPLHGSGILPDWLMPVARYMSVAVVAGVCLMIALWALRSSQDDVLPELDVELVSQTGEEESKTREELAWGQVCEFVEQSPDETGRLLEAWIQSEE